MDSKISKFFSKHAILLEDIKYIVREDGKTNVYLIDGRVISTYHPVKDFCEFLPVEQFLCPNKGIIAAGAQIVDVSNGCYVMADGRTFKYRVHNSQLHDNRMLMLGRNMERVQAAADAVTPDLLQSRFSVFDKMPFAICVIEYIPEKSGFGADFIFRYCNQAMTVWGQLPMDKIVNRSYFDVFPDAEHKWLVAYADVVLNDTVRVIEEYSPEKDQWIQVYCYQPIPRHCACALVPFSNHCKPKDSNGTLRVEFL